MGNRQISSAPFWDCRQGGGGQRHMGREEAGTGEGSPLTLRVGCYGTEQAHTSSCIGWPSTQVAPLAAPQLSPTAACPMGGARTSLKSWPNSSIQRCSYSRVDRLLKSPACAEGGIGRGGD